MVRKTSLLCYPRETTIKIKFLPYQYSSTHPNLEVFLKILIHIIYINIYIFYFLNNHCPKMWYICIHHNINDQTAFSMCRNFFIINFIHFSSQNFSEVKIYLCLVLKGCDEIRYFYQCASHSYMLECETISLLEMVTGEIKCAGPCCLRWRKSEDEITENLLVRR